MVEKLGSTGEVIIKNGMLVEHDLGRSYVKELIEGLEKVKAGNEEAKLDIIAAAISYTHLLEKHIDKEDDVLIEEVKQDGYLHGFTSDYIPIKLKGNYKINEIYKIKLSKENINFSLD